MAGNGYTTASRTKILDFLKANCNRTVNVSQIQQHLKECQHEVNVSTIYRYLEKLSSEGTVMKYVAEKGGQTVYQYVENGHHCKEHLHLQCLECGEIVHLECDFMKEILTHVKNDHGFQIQCMNSIIYGYCEKCQKQER